jgi:hypothetical protein
MYSADRDVAASTGRLARARVDVEFMSNNFNFNFNVPLHRVGRTGAGAHTRASTCWSVDSLSVAVGERTRVRSAGLSCRSLLRACAAPLPARFGLVAIVRGRADEPRERERVDEQTSHTEAAARGCCSSTAGLTGLLVRALTGINLTTFRSRFTSRRLPHPISRSIDMLLLATGGASLWPIAAVAIVLVCCGVVICAVVRHQSQMAQRHEAEGEIGLREIARMRGRETRMTPPPPPPVNPEYIAQQQQQEQQRAKMQQPQQPMYSQQAPPPYYGQPIGAPVGYPQQYTGYPPPQQYAPFAPPPPQQQGGIGSRFGGLGGMASGLGGGLVGSLLGSAAGSMFGGHRGGYGGGGGMFSGLTHQPQAVGPEGSNVGEFAADTGPAMVSDHATALMGAVQTFANVLQPEARAFTGRIYLHRLVSHRRMSISTTTAVAATMPIREATSRNSLPKQTNQRLNA